LWRGRTPGKAALGLRVVTTEGAPIRFRHALVRGVLGLVDFFVIGPEVGVLAVLLSRRDQRLGDMAAGTLVMRERSGARPTAPVAFGPPRGWEGYVYQLDVGRMSPGDYEAVRAFLLRARDLAPAARESLATRLATPVASRLAPPPPPGMAPELWLWCAAAAYQLRHGGPPQPQWGPPQWGPPQWGPPQQQWGPPQQQWGPPQQQWGPPQQQGGPPQQQWGPPQGVPTPGPAPTPPASPTPAPAPAPGAPGDRDRGDGFTPPA
jgi:hypothetical protein